MLRHQLLEAHDSHQAEEHRAPALTITEYAREFPWTPKIRDLAKRHWGIDEFRPNQVSPCCQSRFYMSLESYINHVLYHKLEIMNAILSKRDVFVIMPTGGGERHAALLACHNYAFSITVNVVY